MSDRRFPGQGPQRQRHGVKKKLVEGAGGFVFGAALVVFLRRLAKHREWANPDRQRSPASSSLARTSGSTRP